MKCDMGIERGEIGLACAYQERFGSQYLNLKNFMYRNLIGVGSNICLIG